MRSNLLIIIALIIGCESPAVTHEAPLTMMPFKESHDSMGLMRGSLDAHPEDSSVVDMGAVDIDLIDIDLIDMNPEVHRDMAPVQPLPDMAPVAPDMTLVDPDMTPDMAPVFPDMTAPLPALEATLNISGEFRGESALEITPPFAARFSSNVCTVNQPQAFCEIATRSNAVHQLRVEDADPGVYLISTLIVDDIDEGRLTLSVRCGEESTTLTFSDEISRDESVWDGVSVAYPSCEINVHDRLRSLSGGSLGNGFVCRNCERASCDPHTCPPQSACDPLSGVCSVSCSDQTCDRAERCSVSGDLCERDHCDPCTTSNDCAVGFDCLDTGSGRACHMRCNQASDCRANEACVTRAVTFGGLHFAHEYCVDELRGCDVTQCVDDLGCDAPLVCAEAIQICAECGDATDCPLERPFCDQNVCVMCREDQDCIDGQICENKICIPTPGADRLMSRWGGGTPPLCMLDEACTVDETCESWGAFVSICTLPCNTRLLCPENATCCNQVCHPNEAPLSSCQ